MHRVHKRSFICCVHVTAVPRTSHPNSLPHILIHAQLYSATASMLPAFVHPLENPLHNMRMTTRMNAEHGCVGEIRKRLDSHRLFRVVLGNVIEYVFGCERMAGLWGGEECECERAMSKNFRHRRICGPRHSHTATCAVSGSTCRT